MLRTLSRVACACGALMVLALVPGCFHRGELNQLDLRFTGLANSYAEFDSGDRLLVDTRICPEIMAVIIDDESSMWLGPDEGAMYREMLDETVTGPGTLDEDGCIALGQVGEVVWDLSLDGEPFERYRFTAVEADAGTQLGFDRWQMRMLRLGVMEFGDTYELVGLADDRDLADLLIPPDTPRYVYADNVDVPMLRLDDAVGRVFFTSESLVFEVEGEGFELVEPVASEDEFEPDELLLPGEVALQFEPGGSATVRTTLPNGEVRESPELIAVDMSAAASLDLMHVRDTAYVFADVRNADGIPIHAAPVTWEVVEGGLSIEPGDLTNEGRSSEYALVDTRCEAPPTDGPETRRATLRARLGDLEDTVVVEWIAEPPSENSLPWEAPEDCQYGEAELDPTNEQGCACTSNPSAPAGPGILAIGLLTALRRRKSWAELG